jgi:hypothetical protein
MEVTLNGCAKNLTQLFTVPLQLIYNIVFTVNS